MKRFKSHFKFTKQERSGIFFLLFVIIILQGVYFLVKSNPLETHSSSFENDARLQSLVDSLKSIASKKDSTRIYPFNPNYITDYKGYTLGMSSEEIDRLHDYRKQDKFVNSAEEFQLVTKVSDSLLNAISPYFKFPEWVSKPNRTTEKIKTQLKKSPKEYFDLNSATAEQLREVNGIGDVLSARITKFRDRLGGFLVNEQLFDVYGLEPEVASRALNQFQVLNPPKINKININSATVDELTSLVYIRRNLAQSIVEYRRLVGAFKSLDELTEVEGFPKEKIARIQLYLTL